MGVARSIRMIAADLAAEWPRLDGQSVEGMKMTDARLSALEREILACSHGDAQEWALYLAILAAKNDGAEYGGEMQKAAAWFVEQMTDAELQRLARRYV